MVLAALTVGGGIAALSASHEAVAAHHGNNYLPLLERYYKSHRPVLFALVDAIELEAASAERAVLDALEFIRANRDRRGDWIEESTVHTRDGKKVTVAVDIDAFAGPMWKRTLRDKRRPGMLARRHLEVCVFSHLAAELRSGDIAVVGSDSYANLHSQLMSWEDCESLVAGFCEQAGIPPDAKALVAYYRAQLTRTATTVDKGYPANTDLRLEGGRPVLARRTGADRRPSALALEAAILDRLPERHLLDILARTAYLTGWPRHARGVLDTQLPGHEVQHRHRHIQRILQEQPHIPARHELEREPQFHVVTTPATDQRTVVQVQIEDLLQLRTRRHLGIRAVRRLIITQELHRHRRKLRPTRQ
jgi:hypothetical protein